MKKIEIIVKLLVLKDCILEWAGIASFFMMFYLFSSKILEGNSLLIIKNYINFPTWVIVISPIVGLILLGLINMFYLMPHKQAYYMKNNKEWQNFRKQGEINK